MSLANVIDDGTEAPSWAKLKTRSLRINSTDVINSYQLLTTAAGVVVTNSPDTATVQFLRIGKFVTVTLLSSDAGQRIRATGAATIEIQAAAANYNGSDVKAAIISAVGAVPVYDGVTGRIAAGDAVGCGIKIEATGQITLYGTGAGGIFGANDFVFNPSITFIAAD